VYAGIRSFEPTEPLGKQALERNRVLVAGKRVHVKFDEAKKDKKDQWVGYVFVHNDMVNRQLVSEGLAFVHLKEGQRHYGKELLEAQKEAMAAKRGIWSDSGILKNTSTSYIGDRKYASFHLPTCEDVKSIKPENRLVLTTKREAFENGLGPCEHCKP
jgi:micrococcal nuclease